MLASITPLGERGRRQRWEVTVVAFAAGAITAGAAVGALFGLVGSLTVRHLALTVRLAAFAVAAAAAFALDVRARRIPGPRRQVDESWRESLRGWVYGLGYGVQLGAGVMTIVSSAATYLALGAALLSASPASGALIAGVYGAIRGATPLAAARVRTPPELLALHRRLARMQAPARTAVRAALILSTVLAAVACLG